MWTYYRYDDGKNADFWSDWYHDSDDRTRGAHDQVWDALEQLEPHQWRKPYARNLRKELIEIYVRSDVQWRILGCYGPSRERKAVTVLLICSHKQNIYRPPNAIRTARKRLKEVKNDISRVISCDRPRYAEAL